MLVYIILYFVRLLVDTVGLARIGMLGKTGQLQLSPVKFVFTLFMVGIRPFYPSLLPCAGDYDMEVYGYCSDRMMVNDTDAFDPMPVYIVLVFLDFLMGLVLVLSLKYTLDKEVEHLNAASGMEYSEPEFPNVSSTATPSGRTLEPWKWTLWPRRTHPATPDPSNA